MDLDLTGLWTRELLEWPGQTPDITTAVHWLQGQDYYVDLRQPAGRPDFSGVTGDHDLTEAQRAWMARQEGFAGVLIFDGEYYTWRRDLDLQPPGEFPDCGRLWFEDGLLKEVGRDVPYLEHWRRRPGPTIPAEAVRYQRCAEIAIVVRVGGQFMYAQPGEIGFGYITGANWRIGRCSLPWREGQPFDLDRQAWTVTDRR